MRRTRKWTFVAQEAQRLADLELSPLEIAERLGVSKSTVTRWMAAGKLVKVAPTPASSPQLPSSAGQTPEEWAEVVRKAYDLDATDEQLVTMAEATLRTAHDPLISVTARLQAMGRFQALVKQLALVARKAEATIPEVPIEAAPKRGPERIVSRRPTADPRALLMAVK